MLILRQHNYTFADKRAIKQFMKLTDYGSHIPKGYKNLTAKDIVKLKDVAKTIDRYGISAANPEEVKYYLNKLGLTEATENYQHLYNKYLHPEKNFLLLDRFRQTKGLNYEGTREFEDIQKLKNKSTNRILDFFTKSKRKRDNIIRRGKIADYNLKAIDYNAQNEALNNDKIEFWNNATKRFNVYDPKTAKTIKNRAKKRGISVISTPQGTIGNWNASYTPRKRLIRIDEGSPLNHDPFTIGHEKGHSNFHGGSSNGRLSYIVDELGASAHSIAENSRLMRKADLEVGRKQLEAAGNTYFNDTFNKVINRFNSNYKRKSLIPNE